MITGALSILFFGCAGVMILAVGLTWGDREEFGYFLAGLAVIGANGIALAILLVVLAHACWGTPL